MTTLDKVLYTAKAHTTGGRDGASKTDDGRLEVKLTPPGQPGNGTNPEQLFAAGYAACFGGAVGLVGRLQKIDLGPHDITADVTIGKDASGGFGLAVALRGNFPNLSKEQAQAVMKAAHEVCPYSKATRGNIEVTLDVA
jgi:osmotically inducible protein OsmC